MKPLVAEGNELVCMSCMDVSVSMSFVTRDDRHREVILYELLLRELSAGPLELLTLHSTAALCLIPDGDELLTAFLSLLGSERVTLLSWSQVSVCATSVASRSSDNFTGLMKFSELATGGEEGGEKSQDLGSLSSMERSISTSLSSALFPASIAEPRMFSGMTQGMSTTRMSIMFPRASSSTQSMMPAEWTRPVSVEVEISCRSCPCPCSSGSCTWLMASSFAGDSSEGGEGCSCCCCCCWSGVFRGRLTLDATAAS